MVESKIISLSLLLYVGDLFFLLDGLCVCIFIYLFGWFLYRPICRRSMLIIIVMIFVLAKMDMDVCSSCII